MTTLHSLDGILIALDEALPGSDAPADVVNFFDQQSARASDELKDLFGLDLTDEATARVVGATVIYLTNRGRELAGVNFPTNSRQAIYMVRGMSDAMHGVCGQIQQRHGKAKGESAQ